MFNRDLATTPTLVSIPGDAHNIVDDHQFDLDHKHQISNTTQYQRNTYVAVPFLCGRIDRLNLVFSCGEPLQSDDDVII
jgi:hypothetical protein